MSATRRSLTVRILLTCLSVLKTRFLLASHLGVVAAGAIFILMAMNSPTGKIGNTPPQTFYLFALVGAIAAVGDLKMILRGGLSGSARIARHLWRMSAALTIASGSFFLGQQGIMPASMRGSPWLFVPVIAPLLLMIFWLIRVRLTPWFKSPRFPRGKTAPQFSR